MLQMQKASVASHHEVGGSLSDLGLEQFVAQMKQTPL